jgi:hypothetical protein
VRFLERAIVLTCALGAILLVPAAAADESVQGSTPAKCEVAVVNPVSGYAECVKPRGAPVEQPPSRPPPTPEECLKHPDLNLESCRQTQSPPKHQESNQVTGRSAPVIGGHER